MSAEGWVLIIGAIFFGVQQTYKMYLDHQYNKASIKRDEQTAVKVEQVVQKVATVNEKVDRVETHTDGMIKKLENASFIAGVKSETDKQSI